jgi:lysophospholipase L1-like esterase
MKRFLVLVPLLLAAATPQSATPLRRHPSNPHYFEFRGQPAVLVTSGEHYGAVMNLDFDYVPYLNELQARNFNLTRLFSGMYVEGWGSPWNTLNPAPNRYLTPWLRSSTPGYADGGNKFDLNQWDPAYFNRLRDFVSQASARGIVVEMVLYCVMYGDGEWNLSPLKSTNNVNGIGTVARDQIFNLSNPAVTAAEDALTAKIVTELNSYDNVYYELCNEPYAAANTTQAWHQHTADKITATEAGLPNKHLIAHNISNGSTAVTNPISPVGILNFHYCNPPDAVGQNFGLGRVIAFDETGFRGSADDGYRTEAWEFLIAGGAVYSNLDWSYTDYAESGTSNDWDHNLGGGGASIRGQLKILKNFMDGFNFVAMSPNNAVVAGGVPSGAGARALVQSGEQYAVYLNGGSQANLVLNLPANSYRAEWVNTKTGAVDKAEDVTHAGGNRTLVSPSYSQDIALRIRKTGAPPPTGTATFYRAINLNGPALSIDGNAWEGSTAPNYTFTGSSFSNQAVALNPATDANRAQMIRSSVWNSAGSNVTLTNVPSGQYQVYLYVWEDNFSVTYSISVEGEVVQSNYASGGAGHWDRLGPWNVDVSDGALNVACSAGDANLSGIEVYRLSSAPPPPPPSGTPTFYRAINLNGDALTIDGNAWDGSSAPNYTYSGSSFSNQAVTLSPATDANRATMIRSSIWNPAGSNVTMTNVPSGQYQVYLYVWEDNFSVTYSISVEGQVVQSSYSSGTGGHWDRLGPWTASVSDGTIQVTCSAGDANLSGIEVWSVSTPTAPPTVTVAASDASASEAGPDPGAFTVTRSGSTAQALTVQYSVGGSATGGSDYTALPGSVTIPAGASSAAVPVVVVNDSLVESSETVVLTLSTSAAYAIGAPSSATVTIQDNDSVPVPPPTGGARVIMPLGDSLTYGFVSPNSLNNEDGGFRRYLWERLTGNGYPNLNFVGSLQNGIGTIDRDHEGHPGWRTDEIAANVNGWLATSSPELILLLIGTNDINQGRSPADTLTQLGILVDRILAARPTAQLLVGSDIVPRLNNDYPNVTAQKILDYNAGIPGLVGSRVAQGKKIGFVDLYALAALNTSTTSTDFGADGLHPSPAGYRKLADAWYGAMTTFLSPPPTGGGTFYRAINLAGGAVTIDGNAWEGSSAPNYTFTGSSFSNQAVALNPSTDANRAAMIRSSVWNPAGSNVTLTNVPSGQYQVYLYVWEDNFSVTYSISVEGQVVQSNYSSGSGGHWDKLGPWTADVSDGTLQVTCSAGDANLSGIEVWRGSGGTAPAPGLVAQWRLDETSGSTAADASGNDNAGTLSPNGPVWTSGKIGGGLDFNGLDDSFSVPSSASINGLKGQMTAAFWMYKRTNAPGYGTLFGRRSGSQYADLWIVYCNNSAADEYSFGVTTSSGTATLTGPAAAGDLNAWVHLAAVYDGGSMILYRNGLEVARRAHSGTIPDESSPVVLGAGDNGSAGMGEYVSAVFDDVRLYNRALSEAEIQTLSAQSAVQRVSGVAPGDAERSSSGSGGSCGLLGAEVLGLFALVRLRRRRA